MFHKKLERRRPITPAARPPATQYYRGSTPTNEQGSRQKRQPEVRTSGRVVNHLKRLPAYFSIGGIIVSLVYCSILGNNVTVVLSGSPLYPKDHYEASAGGALNGSIFNHSKLTLDVRGLKEIIQRRLPEVSDITVNIPLVGRKPVIGLSLMPARFLLTFPGKGSYVIGANGVVLADSTTLDQEKLKELQPLQEDVPQTVKEGQQIMTTTDIAFIETVVRELHNATLEVSQLQLPVGASELFVHLKDEPYIVKFALNGDARQQAGAFLAIRKQLGSNMPSSYIDVRVGERVYVK